MAYDDYVLHDCVNTDVGWLSDPLLTRLHCNQWNWACFWDERRFKNMCRKLLFILL